MLRTVHVHGPLSKGLPPGPIKLDADDLPTLLRGLNSARRDFLVDFRKHERFALALRADGEVRYITEQDLGWSFGSADQIFFTTEEKGSGIEAAAAAIAFESAVYAGVQYYAAVYAVAYIAISVAVSVTIGTISRSLADKPDVGGPPADEMRSYLFDQAVNVEGQGHPIPLCYGRFKCGSVVISADVSTDKQAMAFSDSITVEYGVTATGNVFDNDVQSGTMTLTSFRVKGVATYNAGDTHTGAGYTLRVTSTGQYTLDPSTFAGIVEASYKATSESGQVVAADLTFQVFPEYVGYYVEST